MKFKHTLRGKIADYGSMIFTEVSHLFNEYRALDLSREFPNFDHNQKLASLIKKHIDEQRNYYLSTNGHKGLRRNIAELYKQFYGQNYDASNEITITAGASQGIYTILSTMVRENDEVIIFEPAYDLFAPTVEINQGKPVYIELEKPDFSIDWRKVQKFVTPKTRLIIINNPHNPTGAILKAHDLRELQRIVNGTDILILSDESHQFLVYDGYQHHSIAQKNDLAMRSFIVGSFGKTFHVTGWRVGFCLAPENLMREFRKLHQYIAFNVNTPAQFALDEYLSEGVDFDSITANFAEKRDYLANLLESTPFQLIHVKSGISQLVKFSHMNNLSDKDMALELIKNHGVATVPLSAYSHDRTNYGILRFCFARPQAVINKAVSNLSKI